MHAPAGWSHVNMMSKIQRIAQKTGGPTLFFTPRIATCDRTGATGRSSGTGETSWLPAGAIFTCWSGLATRGSVHLLLNPGPGVR